MKFPLLLKLSIKFSLCTKNIITIKRTHGQNKTKQGKRAKWENKKIWPERYKKKTREELDRREKKKKKKRDEIDRRERCVSGFSALYFVFEIHTQVKIC